MHLIQMGILALIILVAGCTTPLTKQELNTVKTVGIHNGMPKYSAYDFIGSTIFTNEFTDVTDASVREHVFYVAQEYLKKKGYKVRLINDSNDFTVTDMNLYVQPVEIYNAPFTETGYGFQVRYVFGVEAHTRAYSSMIMGAKLPGKEDTSQTGNNLFVDVDVSDMPGKWIELSDTRKEKIVVAIKKAIDEVVLNNLKDLGL